MLLQNFPQRLRITVLITVASLVLLLTLVSLYRLPPQSRLREYFPDLKAPFADDVDTVHDEFQHPNTPDIAPGYDLKPYETPFCAERYGHQYLERFRENATGLCTPDSPSNLTCFHGRTSSDSQVDSFCFGRSAIFDIRDRKFSLGCQQRTLTEYEISRGIPQISGLRSYWYDTGPAVIFDKAIKMEPNIAAPQSGSNITILLKREGAYNPWHCLMEIWSLTMTLDVFRMTIEPTTGTPFFSAEDAEKTRIVILDDQDDGPYFDLWTLYAKRPAIRLKDLPESTELENIIVPLAGATNPLWSGDWDIHSCDGSDLLRTFSHRVLDFYNIDAWAPHSGDLVLTFIDRKEGRRLVDQATYLEELRSKIPHVRIQAVDFTALSFMEQLRIVRETDILAGVHGAGLTHGLFLREGSVMVEILPETLNHKGFRNLAGLAGHTYFSAHGSHPPGTKFRRNDWHREDVSIQKERFMELMEVAVKCLYNKGFRNYDVN